MQLSDVPLPAAVAARPRDPRGYPVPAITPWEDGEPRFAATGTARTYICAVERRCSVCGTVVEPGPIWRVVAGPEAAAIGQALVSGTPYRNLAATVEAPGHRTCMLYAAVVCPYLGRPGARRGETAEAADLSTARGDRRGSGGAVAGFDAVEYRYADGVVLFRFQGLREFRRHELGEEHLDELARAVAGETGPASAPPTYLGDYEAVTESHFRRLLR